MGRRNLSGLHLRPHMSGRKDVEEGEALDPARVIEGKAVADPRAAIVSRHREAHMPEGLHDGDHVPAHGALGIGLVCSSLRGTDDQP